MQIKQRLRINNIIMAMSVIAMVTVLVATFMRINRATKQNLIGDALMAASFERLAFRSDYMRTGSERAREQWRVKHEQIGNLMKSAAETFTDASDRHAVSLLMENQESVGNIFRAIVANRQNTGPKGGNPSLSGEIEDRLLTQLNTRIYELAIVGGKLQDSSHAAITSALRTGGGWVAFVFLLMSVTTLINSVLTSRTIAVRISRLHDGASAIGQGNLNHSIDIKGDDEFAGLAGSLNEMAAKLSGSYHDLEKEIEERKRAEEDIMKLSDDMAARNLQLEDVNRELESFIYSISHDLRAPLRHMGEFSRMLSEDYSERLDDRGKDYLGRIRRGSEKMTQLIDDLLNLSRISRQEISRMKIDISKMARSIVSELLEAERRRNVEIVIAEGLTTSADPRLTEIVLSNLFGNAWKFTTKTGGARIEFGAVERGEDIIYYVKDNGAGFDQRYADKMFRPFHRLHSEGEFPGTGIGLSIVERIIHRHGGRIWAEGEVERGATIYFTLA